MKAIEFEGQTHLLNPPPSMERGSCGALPVFAHDHRMISVWKPTPEELEALNKGYHIALTIMGDVHPPVMMHVQRYTELP
jgi:hypothetical protein